MKRWAIQIAIGVAAVMGVAAGISMTLIVVHMSAPKPAADAPQAASFEPKTLSYYRAHRDEARVRNEYCQEHGLNTLSNDPVSRDCELARQISFGG